MTIDKWTHTIESLFGKIICSECNTLIREKDIKKREYSEDFIDYIIICPNCRICWQKTKIML